MLTQEAELNELRSTIELLRQQGHAQLTPLRRPPLTVYTSHKDVPNNGQFSPWFDVSICWVLIVVLFLRIIYANWSLRCFVLTALICGATYTDYIIIIIIIVPFIFSVVIRFCRIEPTAYNLFLSIFEQNLPPIPTRRYD